MYIDKLDDAVDEYNSTYHRTTKMILADVKVNTYIGFKKQVNDKDPKFKLGDHVRILDFEFWMLKDTHQIGLKKFSSLF